MTGLTKVGIGIGILGLVLMLVNFWLGLVILAVGVAIPVGSYFMLEPAQRRRMRDIRRRKQIGR